MLNRRPLPILPLAALLLGPASAAAFTADGVLGSLEGPSRHVIAHADAQRALTASHPGWDAFLRAEGGEWQVLWDEVSGAPHRIWGSGLDLGDLSDVDRVVGEARGLLARHQALLGVDVQDLRLRSATWREGLLLISFQRRHQGIPVYESVVDLIFEGGRLVSLGLDTYPELAVSTIPTFRRGAALAKAREAIPGGGFGAVTEEGGELVILPLEVDGSLSYHLAWRSVQSTEVPVGRWVGFVDAHSGEVLSVHNDVKFLTSGVVELEYEARTVGDDLVTGPAKHADISSGAVGGTTTDDRGAYTSNGSQLTTVLSGPYVDVTTQRGQDASATFGGGDFLWSWEEDATAAELSVFAGANIVRDRALSITPNLPELQGQMKAIANKLGSCNAFYNGNINFLSESFRCNNTGRIQDVVYHEYGHHYHYSLVAAGSVSSDIGEGSGDYLSATITGSSRLAPGFSKHARGGDGAIRDIEPDLSYPGDVIGESHNDGLIWAGAMWDLRKLLIEEYGEELGVKRADLLFAKALMQGPRLSNCYIAVLVADDDNGDLADGTPNLALIDEAFDAHGLTVGF